MRNLRVRARGHGGREGKKMKQDRIRRETNHKRLLISGSKLRVAGGEGVGRDRVTG